jgi:hypothetical protein
MTLRGIGGVMLIECFRQACYDPFFPIIFCKEYNPNTCGHSEGKIGFGLEPRTTQNQTPGGASWCIAHEFLHYCAIGRNWDMEEEYANLVANVCSGPTTTQPPRIF